MPAGGTQTIWRPPLQLEGLQALEFGRGLSGIKALARLTASALGEERANDVARMPLETRDELSSQWP